MSAQGNADSLTSSPIDTRAKETKWYERISIGGYTQVRYNRLLETNPKLKCDQCDASWGEGGGLFIRRARLKFSGDVHPRVYLYLQADMASAVSGSKQNFLQMRDAYFDLALNEAKSLRIRFGQSKIPFGFENMQSSQNRLPLDRGDGINSALKNERDIGAFLYWAPKNIRKRFSMLLKDNLKGSGDYGMFAFGVFNGQTANRDEANNGLHTVARFTYPFQLPGGRIIEPGIQAYSGIFTLLPEYRSAGLKASPQHFLDQRAGLTLVVYPQKLGFQSEFNIGKGPEFDTASRSVMLKPLMGGYAMLLYKATVGDHTFFPFVRAQYYKGGKKHEQDARSYLVKELEAGVEWQPFKNLEIHCTYVWSDRAFIDLTHMGNQQSGRLLRLQVQVNY